VHSGTTPGQSSAISGCAWVGGLATCALASTASFEIGYPLTIAGVTPPKYNIAKTTVTGISGNQISYALTANPGVYKSGGTASEPSATLSTSVSFLVTPQILSFNPSSGVAGTPVVITGVSLGQTTKVLFGTKAAKFTIDSDTQVTAVAPKLLTPVPITVITKGGTATSATSFTP
jgi:hypothetical protein